MQAPPKSEFETKKYDDRPPRVLDAKKPGLKVGPKPTTTDKMVEFGGKQAPSAGHANPPQKL